MGLSLVAIFCSFACFFCSYIFSTFGIDSSLLLILFLRDYIYFVCRLCVIILRRVKTLLPWILFKVCLPFRWEKYNFWRMKRFKISSNSFIFQKMWDVVYEVYVTPRAALCWFQSTFEGLVIVVNWNITRSCDLF